MQIESQGIPRESLSEFVKQAEAYCELIQCCPNIDKAEFVRRCTRALASLYSAALCLPVDTIDEWPLLPSKYNVTQNLYRSVETVISSVLAEENTYWEVYNPYEPSEVLTTTLSDDLSDIYGELLPGLALFKKNRTRTTRMAVTDWTSGFKNHWGDHLVDALRSLHRLRVSS